MRIMRAAPQDAVHEVCSRLGLSRRGLTAIRSHATPVFLLPGPGVVARVKPRSEAVSVARQIALVRWLLDQQFPAAEPLPVPQPIEVDTHVVTLWVHYPQTRTEPPPPSALGSLLKDLHRLPYPPVELRPYQPLASLRKTVAHSANLAPYDRRWLRETIDEVLRAYHQLHFPLGHGFIHGDAYPGNTLWDGTEVRLGDWDEAATGPRELDLANTFQGTRFGRTPQQIAAFVRHYGHDPSHWNGLPTLIRMRDLQTLGSFIRRAGTGDPAAVAQLQHRLTTLRTGQAHARWDIH
ncbi:phosphotransferase enzyme family protein [Streptomyces sp. NPDC055078]